MATMAMGTFAARRDADRSAYLIFVGLVWIGILSGFGTDSYNHVRDHGLDYPLIVHAHAVAFVGWLSLFTVQVALIRAGRPDLHRRLGIASIGLAVLMLILGPTTAIIVDGTRYVATGRTPEFLAIQLTDILAFATLTGAAMLSRRRAAAHKRLMLLGLFYISNAGFARYLNDIALMPFGDAPLAVFGQIYLGGNLLALGLGAYDWRTRGRLHPAYLAGVAWSATLQLSAVALWSSPAWKALSLHLIGY